MVATRLATLPEGDHTDPATPGLQLRVRRRRDGLSRTWLMRYRWRAEWVRIVIGHFPGTPLAEARETAQALRKAIGNGIDPRHAQPRAHPVTSTRQPPVTVASPGAKHSLDFLVSEFLERHVRSNRKQPEYVEAILKRDVLSKWAGRDARTIKPREVIELLDGIVERGSRVMANRVAGLLGQLFRFGIHRAIVDDTPVKLLMRPGGKERPRSRVLSDDELRIFLADPTAGTRFPRLAHVMLILLLTGQRRGELVLARWREIDFNAKTWRIPDENAKTRGHLLPLSESALREFRHLKRRAGRSSWVLPARDGSGPMDAKLLTRGLAKCRGRFERLGIAPFTLHDLRRTCRTGLARLRVPPHIAERVLNHAQERIPGTYDVHDYLDEKRAALDEWARHLEGLTGSPVAATTDGESRRPAPGDRSTLHRRTSLRAT